MITRRDFVAGAMSLPVAASALGQAALPLKATAPLASLFNMNSYQMWTWHFELERAFDGTFTLLSRQEHEDPDDEPWEIEPLPGLQSGQEVFQALRQQLETVGEFSIPDDVIDGAEEALRTIDPILADGFRAEAEEWL